MITDLTIWKVEKIKEKNRRYVFKDLKDGTIKTRYMNACGLMIENNESIGYLFTYNEQNNRHPIGRNRSVFITNIETARKTYLEFKNDYKVKLIDIKF